jgi:methyltransferase (TIGR00027 family)
MERDRGLGAGMMAMALFRTMESSRPEGERLFDDPVSRKLLTGFWRFFLLPGPRQALVAFSERRGPGALGNLFCRTRYIDDALRQALANGLDQIVILGAGFDLRALRIPHIEEKRVFEVDLPAPQRLKQARLEKVFGSLPSHVAFVPVDFDQQNLGEEMAAAGFREGGRTFFIWEGVTQYITAEAVDATFRYVSCAASSGSRIVFTYIPRGIVDGYARSATDEKVISVARQGGSPWIFGIDPSELEATLGARGLVLLEEVWAPDYRERYLDPIGRELSIYEGERVVLARVA